MTSAATAWTCQPFGIGHRGARMMAKENTLEGFRKCVEIGVDMIEFDINITSDNVLVIYHDQHMPDNRFINQMTFGEFRAYDQDFPSLDGMLSDPVILNSGIRFNFDIKDRLVTVPMLHMLRSIIEKDPSFAARCYVASFDREDVATALAIRASDSLFRDVRIGGIYEDEDDHDLAENAAVVYSSMGLNFISVKSAMVTPELIKDCHERNLQVFSWTLNTEEDCERLRGMNLDGFCGDDVGLLMKYQARRPQA